MYSEAHDDLYQFSFESRRWFPCALRKPRGVVAAGHAAQPAAMPPAEQGGQPKDGAGEVLGDAAGQPDACAAEGPPANRTVRNVGCRRHSTQSFPYCLPRALV